MAQKQQEEIKDVIKAHDSLCGHSGQMLFGPSVACNIKRKLRLSA